MYEVQQRKENRLSMLKVLLDTWLSPNFEFEPDNFPLLFFLVENNEDDLVEILCQREVNSLILHFIKFDGILFATSAALKFV